MKVAAEPLEGVRFSVKVAVCPLATVWLLVPVVAAVKSNPIPVRGTVATVANTLLARLRLPVCAPALAGANSTPTLQLAPAASDVPQVFCASVKPGDTVRARSASATAPLEFVTVTVTAVLVVPTPVTGKLTCAGSNWTAPVNPPVPLSATVAAVIAEVELALNAPVKIPLDMGVKTTPVEQLAPAPRLVPQVFCARLNGPETASAKPLATVPPVLVIVTDCGALPCPSACAANVSCAGLALSPAPACPVPVNATVAAATPAVEEETVRLAATAPDADGVKITCTVQVLPFAKVAPQVVVPEKLVKDWPAIWNPTFATGIEPVLVTVRD